MGRSWCERRQISGLFVMIATRIKSFEFELNIASLFPDLLGSRSSPVALRRQLGVKPAKPTSDRDQFGHCAAVSLTMKVRQQHTVPRFSCSVGSGANRSELRYRRFIINWVVVDVHIFGLGTSVDHSTPPSPRTPTHARTHHTHTLTRTHTHTHTVTR